ncbi:isoaspartyl peptidase/L-asparaginase [Halalkalicoccus sp. GCM10025322]|uniref:isoaspartyl peptidase/L-asparaginase n=1 Tax=Halalkalicoccus TaxID=332246 RepID=UPI002F967068
MDVIVHGGVGSVPTEPKRRLAVIEEAAETGSATRTPVEAVRNAVRVLETSPRFNAGVGGAVQSDGVVRTDAGIMTSDRSAGAACAMPGVRHAVDVARAVMEETPHVLLAGERAVAFAADYGIETDVDLWTDRTRERWAALSPPEGGPRDQLEWVRERFGETADDPEGRGLADDAVERSSTSSDQTNRDHAERGPTGRDPEDHDSAGHGPAGHGPRDRDTVGAVARDGERIAAATSTGGRWLALAGRVGDVPQIGSGFYCSPAGGASATGAGEEIAWTTLSRRAVDHLESGACAQDAADRAIEKFAELTGSTAGVIVADPEGGLGSAYNSELMQTKALAANWR